MFKILAHIFTVLFLSPLILLTLLTYLYFSIPIFLTFPSFIIHLLDLDSWNHSCFRIYSIHSSLFHDYADLERSISIGTATCGSLEALGSGDVEFRYPFGDIHVIFTLRDCLYAPMAPTNLLSVGTLVERGMSCLFSPGGVMRAFYPADHSKILNLTFSATVVNCLSFFFLDFIPPQAVASSVPVAFSARVSPLVTVAVSPSQSLPSSSCSQASRRQSISLPRKKLPFPNPHYLIIFSGIALCL